MSDKRLCPAIDERCDYLACSTEVCLRKDPSKAPPPFVRAHTREPSLSLRKPNGKS